MTHVIRRPRADTAANDSERRMHMKKCLLVALPIALLTAATITACSRRATRRYKALLPEIAQPAG